MDIDFECAYKPMSQPSSPKRFKIEEDQLSKSIPDVIYEPSYWSFNSHVKRIIHDDQQLEQQRISAM